MASINKTTTSTGDARWVVYYRDPTGKSREKWHRRKVDAERFARNVEVDMDRGEYVDPRAGRTLFGDYARIWFDSRVHLRPSTASTQRSLMRNHVLPFLGGRHIGAIRPSDVRELVSSMQQRGLSSSTVIATHALVYGALESAATDHLISRNPAAGIDLPRPAGKEMRILDHGQIAALGEAAGGRFSSCILLAGYCGMRFGEIAALRIEDINLLARTLNVTASLGEVGGHVALGPPKTPRSRRKLAVPRFVATHIASHMEKYPPHADGFLFTGAGGGLLRRTNFRKRVWLPAVAATVGQPCTFHDLRHSHAALLIREGLHPKVIQERMGHASIRTTLDTYGHLFPGLDEAAANALDAAARGVLVGLGPSEASA